MEEKIFITGSGGPDPGRVCSGDKKGGLGENGWVIAAHLAWQIDCGSRSGGRRAAALEGGELCGEGGLRLEHT